MNDTIWRGPQYSSTTFKRRHNPPTSRPYPEYRACVRSEFRRTCVYCLSTEKEVAPGLLYGGFEVEHFKPHGRREFQVLKNVYWNLLWACPTCNRAKGDTWPNKLEAKQGYRFIDPCAAPLGDHLRVVDARVETVDGSRAGTYMIDEIYLNSALHQERRRERAKRAKAFAVLEATCIVLAEDFERTGSPDLEERLRDAVNQLAELEPLCLPTPLDGPSDCVCTDRPNVDVDLTRKSRKQRQEDRAKRRTGKQR